MDWTPERLPKKGSSKKEKLDYDYMSSPNVSMNFTDSFRPRAPPKFEASGELVSKTKFDQIS